MRHRRWPRWTPVAVLALTLVCILAALAISILVIIGSVGGSDSCGGCSLTPDWAEPLGNAAGTALLAWLGVVALLVGRALHRRYR